MFFKNFTFIMQAKIILEFRDLERSSTKNIFDFISEFEEKHIYLSIP